MALSNMSAGRRSPAGGATPDPVAAHAFVVDINGVAIGYFASCSGLSVEWDVLPYEEGGRNDYVHKLRGRMKHPNIVLKRGITHESALLDWMLECRTKTARKEGSITLMGPGGKKVRRWKFEGAWPVKWTGPELDASSNSYATETLEIAHRGWLPESV